MASGSCRHTQARLGGTACVVYGSHLQAGHVPGARLWGLGYSRPPGAAGTERAGLRGQQAPLSCRWVLQQTASSMRACAPLSCVAGSLEESAVSLCALQEVTRRGHLTQAAGSWALLQMSSGSCRQASGDGQSPCAACGTGGVMAGLLAGSQVAQGLSQQAKTTLGGVTALQAQQAWRWHLTARTVEQPCGMRATLKHCTTREAHTVKSLTWQLQCFDTACCQWQEQQPGLPLACTRHQSQSICAVLTAVESRGMRTTSC